MAREMKDSGIEWVGHIPKNWNVMANKYVMHKTKEIVPIYCGEDILSLTINGVIVRDLDAGGKMPSSFDGYQRLKPGNLLMCLFDYDVTPRCIGLIKDNGITSPAYSQFIVDKGNHAAYYYYYYLMIDHSKALLHMAKNLRHSFTEEQLGMIYTPVPPVEEQHRIASFLDSKCAEIDKAIEATKASIEEYRNLRQAIITEAVTKGLDPDVEMKDSGIEWIGEIPKHWNASSLKKVLITIKDGTHGTFQRTNHGKLLLSAKNVFEDGLHYFENDSRISEEDYKSIVSNGFPRKDDVLMCCVGTIGRSMVYEEVEPIAFQRSVSFLRCNSLMLPVFLNYYLQNSEIQKEESLMAQGTAQVGLYMGDVINLHIAIPPIEEQQNIIKYLKMKIGVIDPIIKSKEKLIEELTAYRKSLIYEYVTGKKEVPAV